MDLFSVVLHELGHALGLGHSGDPTSVMYPFYRKVTKLAQDDINSILQIYGAQDDPNSGGSGNGGGGGNTGGGTPPPEALNVVVNAVQTPLLAATVALSGKVTGGQDPVAISWTTDAGALGSGRGTRDWTIPAVPLNLGANRINITATDGTGSRYTRSVTVERRAEQTTPNPTPAAPVIQFVEPAADLSTTAASIRVRGTASQASGIQSVNWRNSKTGSGGLASGTESWDLALVALQSGVNPITVDIKARDGSLATRTLNVTMVNTPVNSPPPSSDTAAPSLAITSPATSSFSTNAAQLTISGNARDNVAVTSVTWATGSGSGAASGTSSWSATVPLLVGLNNIVVRAYDAAGNSSWRAVSITRR
jgi:hypothetical protein